MQMAMMFFLPSILLSGFMFPFAGMPAWAQYLGEALPLINRYLSKPVMLADSATGNIRVGGIYDVSAVKSLVTTLPKVLPVYLTRNQDGNPVINSLPGTTPKS